MEDPAPRSTARRLRPILLGLIGSVFAFLALYGVVVGAIFWLGTRS